MSQDNMYIVYAVERRRPVIGIKKNYILNQCSGSHTAQSPQTTGNTAEDLGLQVGRLFRNRDLKSGLELNFFRFQTPPDEPDFRIKEATDGTKMIERYRNLSPGEQEDFLRNVFYELQGITSENQSA